MQTPVAGRHRLYSSRTPATPATRERKRMALRLRLSNTPSSPTGLIGLGPPLTEAEDSDDDLDDINIQRVLFLDEIADHEIGHGPDLFQQGDDMMQVDSEGLVRTFKQS